MGSKNGKFKSDLEIEKAMYMAHGQPQLSKFLDILKKNSQDKFNFEIQRVKLIERRTRQE